MITRSGLKPIKRIGGETMKIIYSDGDTVLDGYRLPDGDPVLVIDGKSFRFCIGSNPFGQEKIYVQAAKLVDEIIVYKSKQKEEED